MNLYEVFKHKSYNLKCKGSSVDDDGEKFEIINHENDVISLILLKTNKYAYNEFSDDIPITANRSHAAEWEKFDVHYPGITTETLSRIRKEIFNN